MNVLSLLSVLDIVPFDTSVLFQSRKFIIGVLFVVLVANDGILLFLYCQIKESE
jgi:hypothetical protein